MKELDLYVGEKSLKLVIINELLWCRVYFVDGDMTIKLGADSLEQVISKILFSFANTYERKYVEYKETKAFSCFNLMEPHATILGKETEGGGLEFLFFDVDGDIMSLLTLSLQDIKDWIIKLTNFAIYFDKNSIKGDFT